MYPSRHLFFGTIFAGVLFLLFPHIGWQGAVLIIASTVLIDVDHYLYYAYKKKDISLKNAYFWFMGNVKKMMNVSRKEREKIYVAVCFLHGIEVLILLALATMISHYFFFVLIGFAFHLLLDNIHQTIFLDRIDKFSLIKDIFTFKRLMFVDE